MVQPSRSIDLFLAGLVAVGLSSSARAQETSHQEAGGNPAARNQMASKWAGTANLNINFAQSQQDAQSFFLSGNASRTLGRGNRFDLGAFYIFTKQTSGEPKVFGITEDRWALFGRYELPSNGDRFGFFDQRFERNGVVSLDLRSISTLGLGYRALQTENVKKTGKVEKPGDTDWTLTSGISYQSERFRSGLGTRSSVGLNLGSRLDTVTRGGIRLTHNLQFIPAFEDFSDFYWLSTLNIGMPVSGRISLDFTIINDFDSTPAQGARRDNNKYGLTLGYKF